MGLNVSIMNAEELLRYATPSTELELALFDALKEAWEAKEQVLDEGYAEANKLEKALELAQETIETLEDKVEELKDRIAELELKDDN